MQSTGEEAQGRDRLAEAEKLRYTVDGHGKHAEQVEPHGHLGPFAFGAKPRAQQGKRKATHQDPAIDGDISLADSHLPARLDGSSPTQLLSLEDIQPGRQVVIMLELPR
jgi:hypothetical protein